MNTCPSEAQQVADTYGSLMTESEHSKPTNLVRRLTLPKFLFGQAKTALGRFSPYSGGLATSLLQDTVEAFLRILSVHGRVDIKESASFPDLIDKVGAKFPVVIEHRAAILRLNRARVNFKHHGLAVSHEEATGFVITVEGFLSEVSVEALDVEFESISLISQIDHTRTRNWLRKAENLRHSGDYRESLSCASKAMTVYLSYSARWARTWREDVFHFYPYGIDAGSNLEDLAEWTKGLIEPIVEHLDLIIQGVDIALYRRFLSLVPRSVLTLANTITSNRYPASVVPSEEDVHFCIEFVVDSALRMRENRFPIATSRRRVDATRVAKAERDCDIVVYPMDESPEVIRRVSKDDRLSVLRTDRVRYSGYVEVLQDGEIYYVRSDCICVGR